MLGMALLAVFAFGAVSAGAASAAQTTPRWFVNGEYGSGSFTAQSKSTFALAFSGLTVSAPAGECTETGELNSGAAGSPGTKSNVVITCAHVTASNPNCTVRSVGSETGTIKTNTLASTNVWLGSSGNAAGDLLAPTSGTEWASLEFLGAVCPLLGVKEVVKGSLIDEIKPIGSEAVTGENVLPASPILSYWNNEATRVKQTISQLKVNAVAATVTGTFSTTLGSKEPFGVATTPSPRAPHWRVSSGGLEKTLGAGQSRPFTAFSTGPVTLGWSGFSMTASECSESGTLLGSATKQPSTKTMTLSCKGVTPSNPSCVVHSLGQPAGAIVGNLKSTLGRFSSQSSGGPIGETIEGQEPSWFTLVFEGGACPLSGFALSVVGQLGGEVTPTSGVATSGTVTFPNPRFAHYWDNGLTPACSPGFMNETTGLCERSISQLQAGTFAMSFIGSLNWSSTTAGEKVGIALS